MTNRIEWVQATHALTGYVGSQEAFEIKSDGVPVRYNLLFKWNGHFERMPHYLPTDKPVRLRAEELLERFLMRAALQVAEKPEPTLGQTISDAVARTLSGVVDEPWDTLFPQAPRAAFITIQQLRLDLGDAVSTEISDRIDVLLSDLRYLGWDQVD